MNNILVCGLLAGVVLAMSVVAAQADGPQLGHMVFFKLKDASEAKKKELVDACVKYLSGHEGTVYFSAGVLAKEFDREVNDQDWDVALHLVFKDKAAHDKYQVHQRHDAFIKENKGNWATVRVFDSYILGESKGAAIDAKDKK